MKSIKVAPKIVKTLLAVIRSYPEVASVVQKIDQQGGRAFLIGGAVRDLFLKREVKDLDIEVHGLSLEDLEKILKKHGPVSSVGKAFGVLRLHGLDVDWSLPRTDMPGRKPDVTIDQDMDIVKAFERRDLTINAMGIDLVTHGLVDQFGGLKDLHNKILRAPNIDLFTEDPLRFFRVMQFVGRFEMQPDKVLNSRCATMDVSKVSVERIEAEFQKLLLKSRRPSLGIKWLKELGRLHDLFPELAQLIDVPQEKKWHPEGEVFEHTMQSLDAAAVFEYENDREKLIVMFAALCHDLGKPKTTENVDGKWKSLGHAAEGVAPTKRFLKRITKNNDLVDAVCKLVKYHMAPVQFVTEGAKISAYKRLAKKLAPNTTMKMLAQVGLADKQGRNPKKGAPIAKDVPEIKTFLKIAYKANVQEKPEEPILLGRDFLNIVEPGPQLGELVKKAYDLQIVQSITDKDELKKLVLDERKKRR